jgi:hypothetical protein
VAVAVVWASALGVVVGRVAAAAEPAMRWAKLRRVSLRDMGFLGD